MVSESVRARKVLIFNNLGVHFRSKVRPILDLPGCILKGQVPTDKIEYLEKCHRGDPMIILCCGQKVRGIKGGAQ